MIFRLKVGRFYERRNVSSSIGIDVFSVYFGDFIGVY
jgi:hypothetical protein